MAAKLLSVLWIVATASVVCFGGVEGKERSLTVVGALTCISREAPKQARADTRLSLQLQIGRWIE